MRNMKITQQPTSKIAADLQSYALSNKHTKPLLYTAIDLHTRTSVIGGMTQDGSISPLIRFDTNKQNLIEHVAEFSKDYTVILTVESAPLAKWARKLLKPKVEKFIICDPRANKLIIKSSSKCDETDVFSLCQLLRMDALTEVWCGDDPQRQLFREAVQSLLCLRDQQRELKTLIKSAYRTFGILKLNGKEIYHPEKRQHWLDQLPLNHSKGIHHLYKLHDVTLDAWKSQLNEVKTLSKHLPEIALFQQVPGVGEIGSAVFSAIIEDPHRFKHASKLYTYCALGIASRDSDNKPLGYQRLNRSGQRELKNVSYHAWRTGIRVGSQNSCVRDFYEASKLRTGTTRHARLNTQRKILKTLWSMWKHHTDFDPEQFFNRTDPNRINRSNNFLHTPDPEAAPRRRKRRNRRRRPAKSQLTI